MISLAEQHVLITGASAGIGRASALALARLGANILATGRRAPQLEPLAQEVRARGGRLEFLAGDLTDVNFVSRLAAWASRCDILVNNAGTLTYTPVLEATDEDNEAMFDVNVLAAFRVMRLIGAHMAERRAGHIIVMSSIAAREVYKLGAVYCATKHALSAMVRGLRLEMQDLGIRVSEIAPGMVDTEIRDASQHPAVLQALASRTYDPITVEDVADAVVFAARASATCCVDLIELRPGRRRSEGARH
jgi:NADP-dependent 3-hydroxy acid dehydrogenase YdfG